MAVTKSGRLGVSDTKFVVSDELRADAGGELINEVVGKIVLVTVSVTVAVTVCTLPGSCRSRRTGRL